MKMLKQKSHFGLAVVLVAAAMIVAGGVVTASNTGFKLNKPLALPVLGSHAGDNWTSIPFFNPYGTVGAFCTQTGLVTTGLNKDTIIDIDPVTGASVTSSCGTAAANSRPIFPGRGLKIRRPAGLSGSIIIVGSHNPSLSIVVPPAGAGNVGSLWFSVPYHTTAVSANDLCLSSGLTSTGLSGRATIQRVNPTTGAFTNVQCGTAAATNLTLVLGEAVQIRQPGGISFIPAHF